MAREFGVMVAGCLCIDIIPRFPDTGASALGEIVRPGKLVVMGPAKVSTGGPVSNTGVNLKTLGENVCFCARIGDDDFGALTLDYLKASGSADGIRVVPGDISSHTIVIAPPNIDRSFLHHPGSNNLFGPADVQQDLVERCRIFHFGYPPIMRRIYENEGEGLRDLFRIAKEAGATTSCDMSLPDPDTDGGKAPWMTILEKVLPYVDIFLPSIEEAFYAVEPEAFFKMKAEHNGAELIDHFTAADYTRIADKLLELGCKMTALKSGHRGFYFKTGSSTSFDAMGAAPPGDPDAWSERELWCPAFSAPNLASATGSGDSAIAGFLAAYLRGLSLEECLKVANCTGWQNVQELDAISGVGDWDRTAELLAQKMPMNDVRITTPGWTWSDVHELWAGPEDPLSGA